MEFDKEKLQNALAIDAASIEKLFTHETLGVYGSGRVLLKPASAGTGVIAGGGVRAVLELAGLHDILSKSLGSQNPINLVKATITGLQQLRKPEEVAELRGLSVNAVLGLTGKEEADATAAETIDGAPPADAAAETEPEAEAQAEPGGEAQAEPEAEATEPAATEADA